MKIRLTLAMLFVFALGTSAYYNQKASAGNIWADGGAPPPPPPCCGGDPDITKAPKPLPTPLPANAH